MDSLSQVCTPPSRHQRMRFNNDSLEIVLVHRRNDVLHRCHSTKLMVIGCPSRRFPEVMIHQASNEEIHIKFASSWTPLQMTSQCIIPMGTVGPQRRQMCKIQMTIIGMSMGSTMHGWKSSRSMDKWGSRRYSTGYWRWKGCSFVARWRTSFTHGFFRLTIIGFFHTISRLQIGSPIGGRLHNGIPSTRISGNHKPICCSICGWFKVFNTRKKFLCIPYSPCLAPFIWLCISNQCLQNWRGSW